MTWACLASVTSTVFGSNLQCIADLSLRIAWRPSPYLSNLPAGVPLGLAVLAVAQMGVHLVFFLHITTGPDNTNNVLALAFGVLIVVLVVAGSQTIMSNLNDNMMLPPELMNMQMQH